MLSVFGSFSLSALAFVFALAAGAVWAAGIRLSDTTDVLLERFGLGQALGGLILLAVVTNLPEIAITASASLSGELGIAVGNILGGIAIQNVRAIDEFLADPYHRATLTSGPFPAVAVRLRWGGRFRHVCVFEYHTWKDKDEHAG